MMKKEVSISEAHRLINTGCVLLVTSAYKDKKNAMALAWQTPLSSKPLLVGIAVSKSHFTTELINLGGEFVLNIPRPDLLEEVSQCGSVSGRELDKFKEIHITPVPGKKVKAPLIDECIGHIECKVINQYTVGDHIFFVGEVVAVSARKDLFKDSQWTSDARLLHHLGGNKYYTTGQIHTS